MISTNGLIREHALFNGTQRLYRFENDFGASVVQHMFSYGGNNDLYELAVIRWNSRPEVTPIDWDLCYSTPIIDDVIGYLEEDQVNTVLSFIEKLNGSGNFSNDEDAQAWEKFSDELGPEHVNIPVLFL